LAAALLLTAYWPFWAGLETIGIERRSYYLTTSLPAVLYYGWLQPLLGNEWARRAVSAFASASTALFALYQARQAWKEGAWLGFTQSALSIFLFYLLLTCLWFQPWYTIWILALAPLLPMGNLTRLTLLMGFVVQTKAWLWVPLLAWPPLPPKAWRETLLGPLTMGLAWLYALYIWIHARIKSAHSNRHPKIALLFWERPGGKRAQ
jgi:hypothetical protein